MTYFEALGELQQRGFDALKVAQAAQLSALKTSRDCAAALAESSLQTFSVPVSVTDVTAALAAFGFALLEQQVDYAQQMTNALTTTPDANRGADKSASLSPALESAPKLSDITFVPSATPSAPLSPPLEPARLSPARESDAPDVLAPPVAIDTADEAALGAHQKVAAEAWLDAAIIAADHDEALSKVLPAPAPPPVAPGPRLPETNAAAKRSKVATVSGDVLSPKRRSTST